VLARRDACNTIVGCRSVTLLAETAYVKCLDRSAKEGPMANGVLSNWLAIVSLAPTLRTNLL